MTQIKEAQREARDAYVPNHRIEFESSPRWVRVFFGDEVVADSKNVMLMREQGHLPVYYFPQEDVRMKLLEPTDHTTHCPYKGDASYWNVKVGDKVAENAIWSYPEPLAGAPDLSGYLAFYWDKKDAWFEEDEEVYVHPRDPYKRIDVIHSSRHVRVVVAGRVVAETHRPRLLFETGLPTRYYIPKVDVRMDLLVSSDSHTECPYKGTASYYSVEVGDEVVEDIAWYYPFPHPECAKIQNLICFYNERVDALYVDGVKQSKPETPWSA